MKILVLAMFTLCSFQSYATFFPKVVDNLELESYLGKWYQIASTNPSFQKDCVCVTAEYEVNESENVNVTNSCNKETIDGELEVVVGEAKKTRNPAKFNVSFGGFSLPFSNYWIVDLADDYSYAVVSSPFRTPIWILSRTPEMDEEVYTDIVDRLAKRFFDVGKLVPTTQIGCDN